MPSRTYTIFFISSAPASRISILSLIWVHACLSRHHTSTPPSNVMSDISLRISSLVISYWTLSKLLSTTILFKVRPFSINFYRILLLMLNTQSVFEGILGPLVCTIILLSSSKSWYLSLLAERNFRNYRHLRTKSFTLSAWIVQVCLVCSACWRCTLRLILAGTANTPPVPTNNEVRLGTWPNFSTSMEDLNLLPSAETRLKFQIELVKYQQLLRGQLLTTTSQREAPSQNSQNKGQNPFDFRYQLTGPQSAPLSTSSTPLIWSILKSLNKDRSTTTYFCLFMGSSIAPSAFFISWKSGDRLYTLGMGQWPTIAVCLYLWQRSITWHSQSKFLGLKTITLLPSLP